MTGDRPPLAMTMGDPAGIGPELALAAWRDARRPARRSSSFAAPAHLARRAAAGLDAPIIETDAAEARAAFRTGLPVVPLENPSKTARPPERRQRRSDDRIDRARGQAVREGKARAVVTNPIAKATLYEAGFNIPATPNISARSPAPGAPRPFR